MFTSTVSACLTTVKKSLLHKKVKPILVRGHLSPEGGAAEPRLRCPGGTFMGGGGHLSLGHRLICLKIGNEKRKKVVGGRGGGQGKSFSLALLLAPLFSVFCSPIFMKLIWLAAYSKAGKALFSFITKVVLLRLNMLSSFAEHTFVHK